MFTATEIVVMGYTAPAGSTPSFTEDLGTWLTGFPDIMSPAIPVGDFSVCLGSPCHLQPLAFFLTSDNIFACPPQPPTFKVAP